MTNQSTTNNTHNLNTKEAAKMTKTITHGTCGIEMTYHGAKRDTLWPQTTYIVVRNADGAYLENIYGCYEDRDLTEAWEEITHGACPICDGWEDGLGQECTASGWSAVTHEEAEEVKEEALRDWDRMMENEKIR